MSKIKVQLKGVAAELVIGNYMPKDTTIFNNWEEFYHYNDLLHVSQPITEYISEIIIEVDDVEKYKGKIPTNKYKSQKSISPVFVENSLYLRTESAEEATYVCEFSVPDFDLANLFLETQSYDSLFKVGESFVVGINYLDNFYCLEWVSAKPVGNICVLCKYENGFLIPIYDAVNKIANM